MRRTIAYRDLPDGLVQFKVTPALIDTDGSASSQPLDPVTVAFTSGSTPATCKKTQIVNSEQQQPQQPRQVNATELHGTTISQVHTTPHSQTLHSSDSPRTKTKQGIALRINSIITEMDNMPDSLSVQRLGCWALTSLANQNTILIIANLGGGYCSN